MQQISQRWLGARMMKFAAFGEAYTQALDKVFTACASTRGLVLDLRGNDGGLDEFAYQLGGRLVTERTLGHSRKTKTGPGEGDFTKLEHFHLEPAKPGYAD